MQDSIATEWDHKIIDAVSIALDGQIGGKDDLARLRQQIENGPSEDKLKTACEIAVAFIRWAQDLKEQRDTARRSREFTNVMGCIAVKEIQRPAAIIEEVYKDGYIVPGKTCWCAVIFEPLTDINSLIPEMSREFSELTLSIAAATQMPQERWKLFNVRLAPLANKSNQIVAIYDRVLRSDNE